MRRLFLVAAALSVGAVLGSCTGSGPVQAQTAPAARWAVVADSQGGMWRVDTQTGETDHCRVSASGEMQCWKAFVAAP